MYSWYRIHKAYNTKHWVATKKNYKKKSDLPTLLSTAYVTGSPTYFCLGLKFSICHNEQKQMCQFDVTLEEVTWHYDPATYTVLQRNHIPTKSEQKITGKSLQPRKLQHFGNSGGRFMPSWPNLDSQTTDRQNDTSTKTIVSSDAKIVSFL